MTENKPPFTVSRYGTEIDALQAHNDWLYGLVADLRETVGAYMTDIQHASTIIEALLELDWLELSPPQGDAEQYGKCNYCGAHGPESKFAHTDECVIPQAQRFVEMQYALGKGSKDNE